MQTKPFPKKNGRTWLALGLFLMLAISLACAGPTIAIPETGNNNPSAPSNSQPPAGRTIPTQALATQSAIPTLPAAPSTAGGNSNGAGGSQPGPVAGSQDLVKLHNQVAPGVVAIQININQGGQVGQVAGSGFVLDDAGHIVTNNHVVAEQGDILVVFSDGSESTAEVVGTDPDSDLAVIKAAQLPEGVHPLPLGDSDKVEVGQWVVAMGNPFAVGTSMSVGIVSAVGRLIESGVTPFSIPQAIQTDAAINPGNSGGPLIDMNGQVIGVDAQIATNGQSTVGAGVGFAIPSNVVRKVAPVLIAKGSYQWPWLGISGTDLTLPLAQANNLDVKRGAYVVEVVSGGPADKAGLRGASNLNAVNNGDVPTGGDVVVEAGGQPVNSFTDLLVITSSHNPGDKLELTILRDGQRQQVTVTLEPRPANFQNNQDTNIP